MIKRTAEKVISGQISARELLAEYSGRITAGQARLNTYITLLLDRAAERAEEIDKIVEKGGNPGPLAGIPLAVKDNMLYRDARMTCGSRILENYTSPYTATAVARLEEAGAIITAKTNMDEFAMGSSGETSAFGATKNPHDTERSPGGSSSGSAAAVADGQVPGALGSDTGGSVRQPAAFCGVVGLKPTYGLVSRYGLAAFASSLDQIGPITSSVEDAAVLLQVIAGYDNLDSTSLKYAVPDYSEELEHGVKGLRLGIPDEYMEEGLSHDVRETVEKTAELLGKKGAEVTRISLPHTKYAVSTYYIAAPAEASANLARFDGVRYGYRAEGRGNVDDIYIKTRSGSFGAEVKRRIMLGTYALSSGYYEAYYLKAQRARTMIKRDFEEAFREVDLILSPATPATAFRIGEKIQDPLQMYLTDVYTIPANLAGIPGICVPAGKDRSGLPVSAQLLGPFMSEKLLLRAARAIEQKT